ncbi:EAL domain-containing protein [Brevibacillus choshinensis]|uniref:EAL domain-containing protein n=1 Tax=Brevibacillus choshinensis TaxID=54911 RepID=A0ABX7FKR2_BRECH|nr:EAL domain-containing protein [Brevibacillus choshinensis]QRG66808.1 EAL domain-containing protein [Brevibacillus choshinensis]
MSGSQKLDESEADWHGVHLPPAESILDNITNGFFILDKHWRIIYTNGQMARYVDKELHQLIGNILWEVLPEAIHTKFYYYYHKAMEEQVSVFFEDYYEPTKEWLEVRVIPSSEGLIGYAFNITERKKHEELIKQMAFQDYVTGLPNRRSFEVALEQRIVQSREQGASFALFYMDMDRFKNVNDAFGHSSGDQLIKEFSSRLVECVKDNGTIARLGGDEFGVVMRIPFERMEEAEWMAKLIIRSVEEWPFKIREFEIFMTTSIGISFYPQHGEDAATLLKNSDVSLYRSKEKGRNTYTIYHSVMDINGYKRFSLEKGLRKAIDENELELHYQPRVDAKSGAVLGAESLIRWNHPEWGLLSPVDFIPLAEERGLILPLTKWVIRRACHQIQAWQERGMPCVPLSVNVSAKLFLLKDFLVHVNQILKETRIKGEWVEIEITETSILDNQKLVESTIAELKEIGIKVSLDDFGTGYSSLAYLTQFKVDTIKIDRHFIRNVTTHTSSATVIKSVIHLAHGLGMRVVAEGVETVEQLTFLKQQRCDEIQGYIFSKPVPVTAFNQLLSKERLTPHRIHDPSEFENRRKQLRVPLLYPLRSQMTIIKMKDREIHLEKTEVLLEDLSAGGLRFLSHVNLTVNADIIFQFETEILGGILNVSGYIVWKQELENDIYQYGLEFTINDMEQDRFISQLKLLAYEMKMNPLALQESFVMEDKVKYLGNLAESVVS